MLNTMDKVQQAHAALGALIHCAVESDSHANPDGFDRAVELGLISSRINPRTTPMGRGILRTLGLLDGKNE